MLYINKLLANKLIVISIFLYSNVWAQSTQKKVAERQPNIIFIMADDLGYAELGCYGNTFNETPHLDKLAAQGTIFTHAYAAGPVCSPTRASIHSGQYPARVGITDYLPQAHKTDKYLDPNVHYTLNEALSSAGYHTTMIGKWHLAPHYEDLKGDPESHGFDEVIGFETKFIGPGDYFYPYEYIETLNPAGVEGEFLTDRLASEACRVIERNKNNPFFINLNFYNVHTRLDAPKDLVDKYKEKYDKKYGKSKADELFERDNWHAGYPDNPYQAAMIEKIDNAIGKIVKQLDDADLTGNTMVIFYSDNGGVSNIANNGHFRSGKTYLYEGGVRVNLIVRYPALKENIAVSDEPVSSIDFYPTFLDLAGIKQVPQKLDGISIVPSLRGGELDREALFWYYPAETFKDNNRKGYSVRKGDFKYYYFYPFDQEELYDLSIDPGEKNNISGRRKAITAGVREMAHQWLVDVKAPVLVDLEGGINDEVLSGKLTWTVPLPDEGIDGYSIYFLDQREQIIGGPILTVPSGTHQVEILDIHLPKEARSIGVFTRISETLSPEPAKIGLKDYLK